MELFIVGILALLGSASAGIFIVYLYHQSGYWLFRQYAHTPLCVVDLSHLKLIKVNQSFATEFGYDHPRVCLQNAKITAMIPGVTSIERSPILTNHGLWVVLQRLGNGHLLIGRNNELQTPTNNWILGRDFKVISTPTISDVTQLNIGDTVFNLMDPQLRPRVTPMIRKRLTRHPDFTIKVPTRVHDHIEYRVWKFERGNERISFQVGETLQVKQHKLPDNRRIIEWQFDAPCRQFSAPDHWPLPGYSNETERRSLEFLLNLVHPGDFNETESMWQQLLKGELTSAEWSFRLTNSLGIEHTMALVARITSWTPDGLPLLISGISLIEHSKSEKQSWRHELNNLLTALTGYSQVLLDEQNSSIARQINMLSRQASQVLTERRSVKQQSQFPKLENLASQWGLSFTVDVHAPLDLQPPMPELKNWLEQLHRAHQLNGQLRLKQRTAGGQCSTCNQPLEAMVMVEILGDEHCFPRYLWPLIQKQESFQQLDHAMHQLGGHINLLDAAGKTHCQLLLPEKESLPPEPRVGTIMVVDDEPAILEYTSDLLLKAGYEVDCHTDAGAALKALQDSSDQFALIITDHKMPGMSGEVFIYKIKEMENGLPIIVCSGYSDSDIQSSHRDSAIVGYLVKPLEVDALLKLVATYVIPHAPNSQREIRH